MFWRLCCILCYDLCGRCDTQGPAECTMSCPTDIYNLGVARPTVLRQSCAALEGKVTSPTEWPLLPIRYSALAASSLLSPLVQPHYFGFPLAVDHGSLAFMVHIMP